MEITAEHISKLEACGSLGYRATKVANILDVPAADVGWFLKQFADKGSRIRRAFDMGVDKSDFIIDKKVFELAQSGDMAAIQEYARRKSQELQKQEDDELDQFDEL